MTQFTRNCLALLCGVALVWLTQVVAALLAALPGLGSLIRWLKSNNVALELLWPVLFTLLPVVVLFGLVGLLVFRLSARRVQLLVCVAAPFVLYAVFVQVSLSTAVGNSLSTALFDPLLWLSACMAPLGLVLALLVTPPHSEA